jgi:hypothetical protein
MSQLSSPEDENIKLKTPIKNSEQIHNRKETKWRL